MPEADVRKTFEDEGCPPRQAEMLVIAGRQLAKQQEDDFFKGSHRFSVDQARSIGDLLGVDWNRVSIEQFQTGLGVEMEHADVTGGDPLTTGRIVLAHLKEKPDYYTRLTGAGLEEGRSRRKIETYRGWRIESQPTSHRGERMYEVGIYGASGLVEATDGKTRVEAVANAKKKIDDHEAGRQTLNNLRPDVMGASESSCPTGTCHPFSQLVKDPDKFAVCMARAKQIGELKKPSSFYALVRDDLETQSQEVFVVVCVDFRGQLMDYVLIGRGQRHRVAVDIEDVLAPVLASRCDGFCVAHCHPTGIAEPSDADGELTESIKKGAAAACPATHFLDHIVVGSKQWYSFAKNNWKVDGKVQKS